MPFPLDCSRPLQQNSYLDTLSRFSSQNFIYPLDVAFSLETVCYLYILVLFQPIMPITGRGCFRQRSGHRVRQLAPLAAGILSYFTFLDHLRGHL